MASWWRRFAENSGFESAGRSWRRTAMLALGLTREELAEYNGGWDRRVVTHFDAIPGTGPWARHLIGTEPEPVENGVVHMGDPVFHEGNRVVHNG